MGPAHWNSEIGIWAKIELETKEIGECDVLPLVVVMVVAWIVVICPDVPWQRHALNRAAVMACVCAH